MPTGPPPRRDAGHPPPGAHVLTRGKYTGRTLAQCPVDYLLWLSDSSKSETLRLLARQVLGVSTDAAVRDLLDPDPSPDLASVVLPGVIFGWMIAMRDRYAGDPAALAVVDVGLHELKQRCTKFTRKPWPPEGGAA